MASIYRIYYHPFTEIFLIVLSGLGLLALAALLLGALVGWRRRVAQVLVGLMLLTVPVSMLLEELLPMIGRDPPRRVAEVALGMAGFLAGIGLLILGAVWFIRATLDGLAEAAGQRVPVSAWLRLWAPGLRLMLAAVVVFVLAAAVYHQNRFPFGG